MREIKFRYYFKDKENKIHTLTEAIEEIEQHNDIVYNIASNWELIARCEYTGLKLNDKKIYEGDIVCFKCEKHTKDGHLILGTEDFYPENSVQIVFYNGRFLGENKKGFTREMNDLLNKKYFKFEIIGNIYENLELLKG